MEELAPIADRVSEIATRELPAPRTTEVRLYEDGDYAIRTFHTHRTRDGNIDEKTEIRLNLGRRTIERRHYQFDKVNRKYIEDDRESLESVEVS